MTASTRLVIASNRLPFSVQRAGQDVTLQPTSGGLAAALTSVHRRADNVWVGWPGDCSELTDGQRAQLASQLRAKRVVPVELTPPELLEYYDGVCNGVLWPVLHYFIDRVPVALPDFDAYRTANERFAEAVVATYRDGDIVWIHDYHLLLTPALVRARLPWARIGFFFHTPFPPADIFRVLPWRRELVEGVLGATLVGFQTNSDASNFAATARVLTDCVVRDECLVTNGRQVRFGAYPIGIDPARLEPTGQTDAPQHGTVACRPHRSRRLLLGVDRLDYTKGILQRLAAFEQLLSDEPQLHERIEMLQLAVPSRDLVPSYLGYKQEVQECVDRINLRYQTPEWTPIHYQLGGVSPAELRAMYCAADVMLVTSLRDGMNLVAKEFISCRTDDDGVLILSEFAGAAEELAEALIVNPYSVGQLARAMRTALTLDRNARRGRMRSLRQQVAARTVHQWVAGFTADLHEAPPELAATMNRPLTTTIRAAITEGERLSLAFVYEDTLVESRDATAPVHPDPGLLELFRDLSARSPLDLHIVSAIDHTALGRWFELVPVTIWAEHGMWHRDRDERRWRRTQCLDPDWAADMREFLEQFTARTPGSFVEERSTGFAWHFGRLERSQGLARAEALFAVLREAADAMGFSVTLRSSLIEVRPGGLSRERTIENILAAGAARGRLIAFERSAGESTVRGALRASDLLVTVGTPHASADHVLRDVGAVRDVLATALGPMHAARMARSPSASMFSIATAQSAGQEAAAVPSSVPAG